MIRFIVKSSIHRPSRAVSLVASALLLASGAHEAHADDMTTPDKTWTFGGEYRLRADRYEHADFGLHDAPSFTSWQQRFFADAGWQPASQLRLFAQASVATESGRLPAPRPADRSRLDFSQAYVDAAVGTEADSWRARLGRQDVNEGRYISTRELTNLRRTFDGVRLDGPLETWSLTGLAARVTRNRPGAFDDDPDPQDGVLFLLAEHPLPVTGLRTQLVAIEHELKAARYSSGVGPEHRATLGARVFGRQSDWDVDAQVSLQGGNFKPAGQARETIRAWGAAAESGIRLSAPWQPRFAVRADVASGDSSSHDGRLGTFDLPYANLSYLNDAVLFAPRNVHDVQPFVMLQPVKELQLTFGMEWLWRNTSADAVYTPLGTPLIPPGAGGSTVARLPYMRWHWAPVAHVELQGGFVHGTPGAALRAAGATHGMDYGYASVTLRL